jgi:hypothetical protein
VFIERTIAQLRFTSERRGAPYIVRAFTVSLLGLSPLAAQEVTGTLRSATHGDPIAGVLITVSLERNDSALVRTTTNARGSYRVRVGTQPVIVRALRIGQRPVELGRLTLRTGERRDLSSTLPDVPVQLASLTARVESRCQRDPVDGTLIAQLFGDARTALWSSRLAAEQESAQSVFRQVVQRYDTRDRPDGDAEMAEDTLASLRPFRSNDVDRLLTRGFRQLLADNGMIWSAPDAELLTDDRFLSAYCLRLVPLHPDDATLVGVAFEPARAERGIVQVHGTLWLDRVTAALRRIEYGYRNVEPPLARTTPGGVVEYARLDDGIWFVSDWAVRMPRVGNVTLRTRWEGEFDNVTVVGVQVTRGYVRSIRLGDSLRFVAGDDILPGDTAALLESLPASAIVRDTSACTNASTEGLVTVRGLLRTADGAPIPGTAVRARWIETLKAGEWMLGDQAVMQLTREAVAESDASGAFVLCHLPPQQNLTLEVGAPAVRLRTTLRLRRELSTVSVPLTVPAASP